MSDRRRNHTTTAPAPALEKIKHGPRAKPAASLEIVQPWKRPAGAQHPTPEQVRKRMSLSRRERILRLKERRDQLQAALNAPPRTVTRWGKTMELHPTPNSRQRILDTIAHLDLQIEEWEEGLRQGRSELVGRLAQRPAGELPQAAPVVPGPAGASPRSDSRSRSRKARRAPKKELDLLKVRIGVLKFGATDAQIKEAGSMAALVCRQLDNAIANADTHQKAAMLSGPLAGWAEKMGREKTTWLAAHQHVSTKNLVQSYIDKIPEAGTH